MSENRKRAGPFGSSDDTRIGRISGPPLACAAGEVAGEVALVPEPPHATARMASNIKARYLMTTIVHAVPDCAARSHVACAAERTYSFVWPPTHATADVAFVPLDR